MTFYTRLKHLALTSELIDVDREIKSQIIQQCSSSKLQHKGLNEPKLNLQQLLEYGKATEQAETHAANLEDRTKNKVNKLSHCGNTHFCNNVPMNTAKSMILQRLVDLPNVETVEVHTLTKGAKKHAQHMVKNAESVGNYTTSKLYVQGLLHPKYQTIHKRIAKSSE